MKKCLLTILLLIMFFSIAVSIQAQQTTIVRYPDLSNAPEITGGLPHYIKYVFVFSLGIVGVVALLAIIIAGFNYITSVGNPQKAADAKDRIISALLGMILLLGSYVLLKTINPDLLKFKTETAQRVDIQTPSSPYAGEQIECRAVLASWDKEIILAGETANLTLTFSQGCGSTAPQIEWASRLLGVGGDKPLLHQLRPGDTDLNCNKYFKSNGTVTVKGLNSIFPVTFTGRCPDTFGLPVCFSGTICNAQKYKPEEFYVKGTFYIIKDGEKRQQFIPKLLIIVDDEG